MECSLAISNFLEEMSSLFHSFVFFYFFLFLFLFFPFHVFFFLILFYFEDLQYCITFAKHRNEYTTGIPVLPILNPPPSPYCPSVSSQCTSPKQPVSCIEPGLAISLHWSLRKAFLFFLAILWNSAFRCLYLFFSPVLFASLLFTTICKASPDSPFAFWHFFFFFPWGWSWSLSPVQCHEPLSIVYQALYFSSLIP